MTMEGLKALRWMEEHQGRFGYSNNTALRLRPVQTGVGDCSSTIRQAYLATSGIEVGTYSRIQANRGRLVTKGRRYSDLNPALLEPGDIIAMDLTPQYPGYDHVEMYAGVRGGVHYTIGHGGWPANGPNFHRLDAPHLLRKATGFVVRRFGNTPMNAGGGVKTQPRKDGAFMALTDAEQKEILTRLRDQDRKLDKLATEVQKIKGAAGRLDGDRRAQGVTRQQVSDIHEEIKNG